MSKMTTPINWKERDIKKQFLLVKFSNEMTITKVLVAKLFVVFAILQNFKFMFIKL